MAFNISGDNAAPMFDAELEAWAVIQHPTEMNITLELLTKSKKSKEHKARLSVLARKFKRDERQAQKTKKDVDALKYEPDLIQMGASLVSDWRGVQEDNKDLPFDPKMLVGILSGQDWVFDQLDAFQADDENFFTKPEVKS